MHTLSFWNQTLKQSCRAWKVVQLSFWSFLHLSPVSVGNLVLLSGPWSFCKLQTGPWRSPTHLLPLAAPSVSLYQHAAAVLLYFRLSEQPPSPPLHLRRRLILSPSLSPAFPVQFRAATHSPSPTRAAGVLLLHAAVVPRPCVPPFPFFPYK
jgi:hypothetical protein